MSIFFRVIIICNKSICRKLAALADTSLVKCSSRASSTHPRQKIRSYLLTRYLEYLRTYENAMERKFPAAVKLYRGFSVGVKEFKTDLLSLFQVFKKVSLEGKKSLTRRELEVYHRMPKDMIKVAPVLVITALPGGGIIFPLAYMFPRALLSYHFWSLQQRSEFAMLGLKDKLTHYRPVFRCLQGQLRSVKDQPEHGRWSKVLGLLGSGVHPSVDLILECKPLFERKPYHLNNLTTIHVSHLLRVHGMHRGWWRRTRLAERARLLQLMDEAMCREGGPSTLTADELRWSCFLRGFNPVNVSQADTIVWLESWLAISTCVDQKSLSLLLHCPILLGYNQPSNWLLLHDTRT